MAINLLVQDYIFEKYGVEEEDQIKNLQMEGTPSSICRQHQRYRDSAIAGPD
jgi:hypothetical protein